MNIGDVWGATNKAFTPKPVHDMSINDCALLIHHKIVAMQDEFNDDITVIDLEGLRKTTGMTPGSWKAILNLDMAYYTNRQMNLNRMVNVATMLLGLTHEAWLNMSANKLKMFEAEIV